MLWSVYSYAYDNIKKYFANSITTANNVIPAGNYDMTGYSYYPIDCAWAVTINEAEYYHEIKVNHKSTTNLDTGCGTYNDPYIIGSADQLSLVADILNNETPANDGSISHLQINTFVSWLCYRSGKDR